LGDKVSEGSSVLLLESGASSQPAAPAPAPAAPPPGAAPAAAPPPPAAASKPAASAAPVVVNVPDIGDFKDVEVIEVLGKPGDKVTKEQSLITVESDKASMEIPSPAEGTVESLRMKIGDKVSEGKPILVLSGAAPAAETPAAAAPQARATEAPAAPAPR